MLQREITFIELDSSSDTKASKHLIYDILFKDRGHIKSFVHDLVEKLREKYDGTDYIDKQFVCAIDQCVYTPARCFRLIGSSKFGKQKVLKIVKNGKISESFSRKDLFDSFISIYLFKDNFVEHNEFTELFYDHETRRKA